MKLHEDKFEAESGHTLHRYWFEPEGEAMGGLVMVHGLGDYLERYAHVAELFCNRGFICVGVDLPGHGRSSGQRGHIPAFELITDLLDRDALLLRGKLPERAPLGMFAHSMGGFVALDYLPRRNGLFRFAWISSPLIEPAANQPPFLVALSKYIGAWFPRIPFDTKVRSEQLRHPDPATGEFTRDPLMHHRVSAGLGAELVEKGTSLKKVTSGFDQDLRLLMTHGSEDHVCPPKASRALFDALPILRKAYLSVEGSLHEPLHDDRSEWVLEQVGLWLDEIGYI